MRKFILFITLVMLFIQGCNLQQQNFSTDSNNLEVLLSNCEKITDRDLRVKGECYTRIAISLEDSSICKKIPYDPKSDCYTKIAVLKQDLSICDTFDDKYCYGEVAAAKKDISICNSMGYGTAKDSCFRAVAKVEKDFLTCDKIKESTILTNCYELVSMEIKNKSICDSINPNYKLYCLLGSAKGLLDVDLCGSTSDPNHCYFFIAIELKDRSLCDRLSLVSDKERCFNEIDK